MQPTERDTPHGNPSGTEADSRLEASSFSNSFISIDQVKSRSAGYMQTCTCDFRLSQHSPVTLREETGLTGTSAPTPSQVPSKTRSYLRVNAMGMGALPYMARARCYLIPATSYLIVGTAHRTISFGPGRSGYGVLRAPKTPPRCWHSLCAASTGSQIGTSSASKITSRVTLNSSAAQLR